MIKQVSLLLLFDKDKRILFQHRSKDMDNLPNYWAFFGGHIEEGETPEQALVRESEEELEYTPKNPRLAMTQEFEHENIQYKKYVYMEEYDNSKLVQHEGQAMGWYNLDETKNLKMIFHDREVIEFIKSKY